MGAGQYLGCGEPAQDESCRLRPSSLGPPSLSTWSISRASTALPVLGHYDPESQVWCLRWDSCRRTVWASNCFPGPRRWPFCHSYRVADRDSRCARTRTARSRTHRPHLPPELRRARRHGRSDGRADAVHYLSLAAETEAGRSMHPTYVRNLRSITEVMESRRF